MAGFLQRRIERWAVGVQQREMDEFVRRLRGMGQDELGFVVAMAAHQRNRSPYKDGLLDPIILVAAMPKLPHVMKDSIRLMQKDGHMAEAAGWMIWLHTLRAAVSLDLRSTAREMWGELSRGFGSIYEAALNHRMAFEVLLDVERAAVFPKGMEPLDSKTR